MVPILEISLVIFIATTFRTAFGFGEALIAVPLLSLLLPVQVVTPLAVLASILIALVAVIREHRHIHFFSVQRLILSTLLGVPFGLLVLKFAPEWSVKGILGLLILSFSSFSLLKPQSFTLKDDRFVWLFGFLAGVTGGSYGMNGPPLVIYGVARKWSPEQFRATIQAYFFPASIAGMIGYAVSGMWTREVNHFFILSLPAIVAGILCGNFLTRKTSQARFSQFLYVGLFLSAALFFFKPWWRSSGQPLPLPRLC